MLKILKKRNKIYFDRGKTNCYDFLLRNCLFGGKKSEKYLRNEKFQESHQNVNEHEHENLFRDLELLNVTIKLKGFFFLLRNVLIVEKVRQKHFFIEEKYFRNFEHQNKTARYICLGITYLLRKIRKNLEKIKNLKKTCKILKNHNKICFVFW